MRQQRKSLYAVGSHWEAIRDLRVREAELHATVDLRRLEEERRFLEGEQAAVEDEIKKMSESPASVRAHEVLARRWAALAALALGIAGASAWWSFGYLTSIAWERLVLATTLVAIPLVGWAVFLFVAAEHVNPWDLRKILAGLAVVVILTSLIAGACLGGVRMMGASLEEENRRAARVEGESDRAAEARLARVETVTRHVRTLGIIALGLVALASEVAAGLAFHECWKHRAVVRTVKPFYWRLQKVAHALIENAVEQERVQQLAQMLHTSLTVEGLRRESRERSLIPTVRWIVIGTIVLLVCLFAAAIAVAGPAPEVTVLVLDLSTSVTGTEFSANVSTVEAFIRALPAGALQVAVVGVNGTSFEQTPLFRAVTPSQGGTFGEQLTRWRLDTIRAWRKTAAVLRPDASGSDILGSISRGLLELEEHPIAAKRLVLLSDMRQVGRGLNLERRIQDPKAMAALAYRDTPLNLKGIEVLAVAVHTVGITDMHWRQLREFWAEYFRLAGAELKAFTPNRRLVEPELR